MLDETIIEYRIVLVGDRVGKSSIIQRYTDNLFSQDKLTTIGL